MWFFFILLYWFCPSQASVEQSKHSSGISSQGVMWPAVTGLHGGWRRVWKQPRPCPDPGSACVCRRCWWRHTRQQGRTSAAPPAAETEITPRVSTASAREKLNSEPLSHPAPYLLSHPRPWVLRSLQVGVGEAFSKLSELLLTTRGCRRQRRWFPTITKPQNTRREVVVLRPLQPLGDQDVDQSTN